MSAVPSIDITASKLYTAIGGWLLAMIGSSAQVEQGQLNRISMSQGNYIVITLMGPGSALHKGARNYEWDGGSSNPGTEKDTKGTKGVVQLDFYGPAAHDSAALVSDLVSTQYNFDYFAQQAQNGGLDMQPLFAGETRNMALINGEGQYESRWTFDLHFQYNPVITFPQDFMDGLDIHAVSVESQFPLE